MFVVLDGYELRNLGDDKGLEMALGNLDIDTMERIDDFSPDKPNSQVSDDYQLKATCCSKSSFTLKKELFVSFQPSKPRSRSWNDSPAATGRSIWSRGVTPASAVPPQPAASPVRPPSTKGKERVVGLAGLRLPCRELQVKRPREGKLFTRCSHEYSSTVFQYEKVLI